MSRPTHQMRWLAYSLFPKIEAIFSSETLISVRTTRRYSSAPHSLQLSELQIQEFVGSFILSLAEVCVCLWSAETKYVCLAASLLTFTTTSTSGINYKPVVHGLSRVSITTRFQCYATSVKSQTESDFPWFHPFYLALLIAAVVVISGECLSGLWPRQGGLRRRLGTLPWHFFKKRRQT